MPSRPLNRSAPAGHDIPTRAHASTRRLPADAPVTALISKDPNALNSILAETETADLGRLHVLWRKALGTDGLIPLGYDIKDKMLIPNKEEAQIVRCIFQRYLELGSLIALRNELRAQGIHSKTRTSATGRATGGRVYYPGALAAILKNRTYIGEIVHNGTAYPGVHEPILPRELFDRVQQQIVVRRVRRATQTSPSADKMLAGLIFDDRGNRMRHFHVKTLAGRTYRYYVSSPSLKGEQVNTRSISRVSASVIETIVTHVLERIVSHRAPNGIAADLAGHELIHRLVRRVDVYTCAVVMRLDRAAVTEAIGRGNVTEPVKSSKDSTMILATLREKLPTAEQLEASDNELTLSLSVSVKRRSGPGSSTSID